MTYDISCVSSLVSFRAFSFARPQVWNRLPTSLRSQWKENWKSAQVVNFSLVDDPTIRQPGFDLPRQQWSLLNHSWTAQGHCGACKKKWNQAATYLCHCGVKQTMSHIVNSCQSWMVACCNYTLPTMKLLLCWSAMALNAHARRRFTSLSYAN